MKEMVSIDKVIDEVVLLIESIEQQEGHTIISRTLENPPCGYCGWSSVREYVTEMIYSIQDDDLSSKDVVEVVRCRDCIYYQDNNDGYQTKACKWRKDETPCGYDFCSIGERI